MIIVPPMNPSQPPPEPDRSESSSHLRSRLADIQRERNLLRALIDNVPDMLYVKDDRSRFVVNNRVHLANLGGVSQAGMAGKTDFDVFGKELASRYFADEQLVLQTGRSLTREEPASFPSGAARWLSTTKTPIRGRDGRVIGLAGISRDITERKIAQENLERERNLFRTLIDTIPDYIFVKDKEHRFVINNRAHLRILGAKEQGEVEGKTDFEIFPSELASRYFFDEQVVLKSGTPMVDVEEPAIDPSGTEVWLSTTKVPVRDKSGKIIGLLGISRDITERKLTEKALRETKDILQVQVEERTDDLHLANHRLAVRLSQLNFLTTTSYELAQYIHLDELSPAIVRAFQSCFTKAEVSLCLGVTKKFEYLAGSKLVDNEKARRGQEKALAPFVPSELRQPFYLENWACEEHLGHLAGQALERYPFYLALPLLADNRLLAIVQVFATSEFGASYDESLPVLTTLASHAGTCLSNALNYRELGEKARLQGELDAARSILEHFTTAHPPKIPRCRVHGLYQPAFEVGGDYLDYFRSETGQWVVVISDVCGKGIAAALFMVMLRSAFRGQSRFTKTARELLCAVNREMKPNLDDKSFVTAGCLVIEPDGSSMTYARAGHPHLIVQKGPGFSAETVPGNGLALGLVPEIDMFESVLDEIRIELEAGSRFVMYTDGLTEAAGPEQSPYGVDRLKALLASSEFNGPKGLIDGIVGGVRGYLGDAPLSDDLTIVALEISE